MNATDGRSVDDLFDLSDEVALVTGATGQLGRSICEALAEQGCDLVVNARTSSDCQFLADDLATDENSVVVAPGDVTVTSDVKSIMSTIESTFETLDILVNNAYSGTSIAFEDLTKEEFNEGLEMGVTSMFLCAREALPLLKDGGGRVINVSSIYGVVAPNHSIYGQTDLNNPAQYGTAKAGVIQLTRWIATRYASEGIRANSISPGGFYNPDLESEKEYEDVFVPNYEENTPLGRMGDPEDMKGPISFLASDASSWVTGENLVVDGGWTAW